MPVIAMMPPKAETGSERRALSNASLEFSPMAAPQGWACLMMAAAWGLNHEDLHQGPGSIGIINVVVGKFLPLMLPGLGKARGG